MLRKWPTPESCWPWLLAFYARKGGRDEWKRLSYGNIGMVVTKKMGKGTFRQFIPVQT